MPIPQDWIIFFVEFSYCVHLLTVVSNDMSYILAPSSLAGRVLGVGFLYLITPGSAVYCFYIAFNYRNFPTVSFNQDHNEFQS